MSKKIGITIGLDIECAADMTQALVAKDMPRATWLGLVIESDNESAMVKWYAILHETGSMTPLNFNDRREALTGLRFAEQTETDSFLTDEVIEKFNR